jgi:hypothetical protein
MLWLKNEPNSKSNLKENDYIITDEIYNTFEDGLRSIGKILNLFLITRMLRNYNKCSLLSRLRFYILQKS